MEAYSNSIYARDCNDQKSISRYSTLVGKVKSNTLSLSGMEVQCHAMMHASFEIIRVHSFILDLGFLLQGVMIMHCDN